MTRDEASRHCRNGAVAAFVSAAITAAVMALAMSTDTRHEVLRLWNDPTIVVDIVLILACAIGMLRHSRAAAIMIFVYFVLAKIYLAVETGQFNGLLIAFVFLFFYGRAIQGAFAWHRIQREQDPDYRAAPRWVYWAGIPALVLGVVLFGLGLLSMTDAVPSTEVVAGDEVSSADHAALIDSGVLWDSERIQYFYSYGLTSVLEGGSVLTDRAVVMYYRDEDGAVQVFELPFAEIDEITMIEEGGIFSDAYYEVTGGDADDWIQFALSTENDGHLKFIAALERSMERSLSNKRKTAPNVADPD